MSRISITRTVKALSVLLALLALCLAARPPAAQARAYTYGTGAQRTINAGILLLDGNVNSNSAGADNKDPYVFYILNQRTDIKPYGWNIVNPLAPKAVSPEIQIRWDKRTGQAAGNHVYALGQTVTPAMAAYWEVPLTNTQIGNLSQFDVLLVNINSNIKFTAADTEKLRRFVDGGGTLWIENSAFDAVTNTVSAAGPLFFPLKFDGTTPGNSGYAQVPSFRSPVITSPYLLSQIELNGLGDKQIGNYDCTDGGAGFLTSVVTNSGTGLPVIAAAQFGAGQVVVTNTGSADAINQYVGGTNVYSPNAAANSGPFCGASLQLAPTADLKLLSDILAAADTHPQANQNSHQNGATASPLSSAVQIWKDTTPSGGTPAGAATYGPLAFVTVSDTLYAYYIHPSQDPSPSPSLLRGNPYDLKWSAKIGANLSAPTVATVPLTVGGKTVLTTVVFVEEADGTIQGYDAATGTPGPTLSASNSRGSYTTPAPAPTVYNGSVYAGGQDGSLFVYDFEAGHSASGGVSYSLVSSGTSPPVTASPTVGVLPDGDGGTGNEIIALVPTSQYVYTVFLGARGERLPGAAAPYMTKLGQINGSIIDQTQPFDWRTYTLDGGGFPILQTSNVYPTSGGNTFTGTPAPPTATLYADYDSSLATTSAGTTTTAPGGSLTRTGAAAASVTATTASGFSVPFSAPALDRQGNAYYTTNNGPQSLLSSFHDSPRPGSTLNWVFQLPRTGDTIIDADGTNYSALAAYKFVGAPVADAQGNVYALASDGSSTAVLCFNGLGTVSADLFGQGLETTVSGVELVQPDPVTATQDLFGTSPAPQLQPSQITIGQTGHVDFRNFGTATGSPSLLYPTLVEPYPVAVQYTLGDNNPANTNTPQQAFARMHTNLSWYTILPVAVSAPAGLAKAGNALFFVDSTGGLDRIVADPQAEGIAITSKYIVPTATGTTGGKMATPLGNAGIGGVVGPPCISNGSLILAGSGGVAAYTNQVTLVVDANRVLEMDSSGNAQWAVDATSRVSLEGDTTPIYSANANGQTGTGRYVTTTLELNRPSSLTELTPNDYLVADTGNNRCVRFDRAGRVIWELTKFTDPNGLLKPGEPDTLNQPTSVQIHPSTDSSGNTLVQYLISDSGNYRVVEVDDIYDSTGKLVPNGYHALRWVSHTHDVQGREYRYQSAAYYAVNTKTYVAALITNKRLAGVTNVNAPDGSLLPANQDAAGGSIVLLDYYPNASPAVATDGYITASISSFVAPLKNGQFNTTGTATTLLIRNPRYLKAYVPAGTPANSGTAKNLLLADDNGVWDLTLTGSVYTAQFGFTQNDYRSILNTVGIGSGLLFSRSQLPFTPGSIQILGGIPGASNYLITNSFSQGEAANDPTKMGGEVFEADQGQAQTVTGGYAGHTLSRPVNTSPLSQPTFAYRLQ